MEWDAARRAAKDVLLLLCDVDGTLTDGGLYYDRSGAVGKVFHAHDGFGVKLAQANGLEVGVVSGRPDDGGEARLRELGVAERHYGRLDKIPILEEICGRRGLSLSQIAFLGDDWLDLAAMRACGLGMAVADAQPEVLAAADWVSRLPGGRGAARDAIRFLLEAQGKLETALARWSGL